jgi:ferrous iron transporter FeoB
VAYKIALAGNPNSGKTTLFNALTGMSQHVGNWPGVTVEKKEGTYKRNKEYLIVDLPGTYSLSPYSIEEIVARDYIIKEQPDVVINIIDATSLERNLYLTLQIIETGIPTVIALNMMDEAEAKGISIDIDKLSKVLGVPIVSIVARSNKGIHEVMDTAKKVIEDKTVNKIPAIFSSEIINAVNEVKAFINTGSENEKTWKAIKFLEGDDVVTKEFSNADTQKVLSVAQSKFEMDLEATIADQRYNFIGTAVSSSVKHDKSISSDTKTDKIDKILTNRILALPIFVGIMYLLFAATFSENFLWFIGISDVPSPGIWLAGLVEGAWGGLTGLVESVIEMIGVSEWLIGLIMSCMEGVGAVLGFLPLVLVLFLLLSFLEDSGYMARVAFVMDRFFRYMGLSGRSFIPLLMGFGCSVPALMASRTLENEKDRKITMMITPFMSCGAKLPIYLMFVATLFADSNLTLIMFTIYMVGIVVAILSALLLGKLLKGGESSGFVMELPQYRIPTFRSIVMHGWEKVKGFAIKAGTIIFFSTILIWLLSNFNMSGMCDMEESFLAIFGNAIAFIFKPLGFGNWRASVGVVTGWIAKENIVATFAQLFAGVDDEAVVEAIMAGEETIPAISEVFTKASAWSYMIFNLLCMPCFAAVGAIKREMGSWKWTIRAVGFQMAAAYVVSFIVYMITSFIY